MRRVRRITVKSRDRENKESTKGCMETVPSWQCLGVGCVLSRARVSTRKYLHFTGARGLPPHASMEPLTAGSASLPPPTPPERRNRHPSPNPKYIQIFNAPQSLSQVERANFSNKSASLRLATCLRSPSSFTSVTASRFLHTSTLIPHPWICCSRLAEKATKMHFYHGSVESVHVQLKDTCKY